MKLSFGELRAPIEELEEADFEGIRALDDGRMRWW